MSSCAGTERLRLLAPDFLRCCRAKTVAAAVVGDRGARRREKSQCCLLRPLDKSFSESPPDVAFPQRRSAEPSGASRARKLPGCAPGRGPRSHTKREKLTSSRKAENRPLQPSRVFYVHVALSWPSLYDLEATKYRGRIARFVTLVADLV